MSAKDQIRKKASIEKEKLKNMSLKDKIWYISEYYKFHIIGVILAFILLYVIGSSIYRSTFDNSLYCMFINNRSGQELNTDLLTVDFHDYMGFTKKQVVNVESSYLSFGDDTSQLNYASMTKISALVASRELDIIIGDPESIDHYAAAGGFLNPEETIPEDILSLVGDRLYYAVDDEGVTRASAIDLQGTQFAADMHLSGESALFGIMSNSKNTDNSIALLQYIFAQ